MVSVIDWVYPWQLCPNSLTICSYHLVCHSSLYPPCILLSHIFFYLFISVNCNFETPLPWSNLSGSWKTFDQWPPKQIIKSWNYTILLISNYIHYENKFTKTFRPTDILHIQGVSYWSMQSKSALRDRKIHNFIEFWCLVGSRGLEIWVSSISFQKR